MNFLQKYQQFHNLHPDGIIGKNTASTMMQDLDIPSIIEYCHFIAQIMHESNYFTAGRENVNYSADGLQKYFKRFFTDDEILIYARHAKLIANRIYADRMGNGDEHSGDGWMYRGTGAIQLTGKTNHQDYFKYADLPMDTDPNILLTPEHYFKTAKYYFDHNSVWQYCTKNTDECVVLTSKKINLGSVTSVKIPIGLTERLKLTNELFSQLC